MRIAEYKQIDTKVVSEQILEVDENDEQIAKIITKEIPIMGMVYRDMTAEEIAEYGKMQSEVEHNIPLSAEERIEILEDAFAEFVSEVLSDD